MSFWKRIQSLLRGEIEDDQEIGAIVSAQVVEVLPSELYAGEQIEVRYAGWLSEQDGPIHVHYGTSSGEGPWRRTEERLMHCRADGVCTAIIELDQEPGQLHLCFRNDQGEWDNNYEENWTFPFTEG